MIDTLTHQQNMERTVLGTMMLDEPALTASAQLEAADFSLSSHRKIFSRIQWMHRAGEAVNVKTLCHDFARTHEIEDVGGMGYLFALTEDIPRNYEINHYVALLRRNSTTRNFVKLCELWQSRLASGDQLDDVVSFAFGELMLLKKSMVTEGEPQEVREWVPPAVGQLEEERNRGGAVLGIPTGIRLLDEATTGWRNGELTYVGAYPSRGKTAFLLQCLHAAAANGYPCGLISLEMRKEALMRRLTVIHGKHSAKKMRDPRLMNEEEWEAVKKSLHEVGDLPVTGTDVSDMSPARIALCAHQMYKMGARIIFVDFVQIIREDGRDRREAINRVSAALRDTCKSLNIPFVVASQLARRDTDINRRPTMQDLRESGNLEQDAHRVLLLHRPMANGSFTGEDEIIIAKQREGTVGPVAVRYNSRTFTFEER